jgi:hypothetical protein
MASREEILGDMLASLRAAVPDLDVGIGSVMRKIYDPVAEAIAERDLDKYLYEYAYDIDAKQGGDLDEMVRLFGITRLPARRSYGEVTFSRNNPSAAAVRIPTGTQVQTDPELPPVAVVQTIVDATIPVGLTSVTVPCVASLAGADGNVSAGTLTFRRTALAGITAMTNTVAFTGGLDEESDTYLRRRFKETVFRNLAGTSQMYRGIALDVTEVTQANVIGATKRWIERVEIVSGAATTTVQDATYIVPDTGAIGADLTSGDILRESVHYTINYGVNPPTIAVIDGTAMPDGIYDVEFDYVPSASRNDLENGISNRVDVYVKGERAIEATATLVFDSARTFNNTSTDRFYRLKFKRRDESSPVLGNFFVPYPLVPVLDPSISNQITIDGVTYTENTHYWLVHDVTSTGMAPRSFDGIEIRSQANGSPLVDPPDGDVFAVTYTWNEIPADVSQRINNTWRLTNQDAWVHSGLLRRLRFYFAAILSRGFTKEQVEASVATAISNYLDSLGFNTVLQASDILSVAHAVPGIDSIRFLTDDDDPTNYAIQRVNESGSVMETFAIGSSPSQVSDVPFGDNETPVFDDLTIDVRAQNTWGAM